jgi:hypothetical protein
MSGILPLHIQRRLEQRWAARFASPAATAAPKKRLGLKVTVNSQPRPAKAKEKPAGLNERAQSVLAVRLTRSAI